ncbi:hypothetical protein [Candidatus Nitrosocosmicus arcticus]|uniref:Uncharacterized protein n=1 Tax=Candidatus Nitrosocosmicus arcticus TaxID=2035267 RepID=A0A557SYM4_9ARCH|nr:hypothetical protein [Candidatus Nitrosocosmicus arcticus]TVP41709.1 hypothetical protein NARC_10115 [Candidatus Nitrosocosmicus arcticus]
MTFLEIDTVKKAKVKKYLELKQKCVDLYTIYTLLVIGIFFILISQMVVCHNNLVPIKLTYGENSDVTNSVKEEQPANETQLFSSYKSLITNNFPYPIHFVEKFNVGPAIIYNGIVISKNLHAEDIELRKWGIPNNLNLYNFSGPNKNIKLFNIDGNSYGGPSGFESSSLNYTDRYISLNFGSIYKYPETAQVAIQLEVVGELSKYHLIFVNGRLGTEGWVENNLYRKITSNSSQLVDLVELISSKGDKFLNLDKIYINIEKDTQIGSFPFRIDFGKSTINTPEILDDGSSFFVNGFVFQDNVISNDFKYIFEDWEYKQILNQEFIVNPSDHHIIAANNWEVKKINKSKDNLTNNLYISLISEKNIPLWDLPILKVIPHLDIHNSLLHFGSPKDILFLSILVLLITLTFHKRKSFSNLN